MKYIKYIIILLLFLSIHKTCFARGKIVDYFLKNPTAWDETKRLTHVIPVKIEVTEGREGLGFELQELTMGDEVALVFLETQKAERIKKNGFYDAADKLLPGNNRVVAVITKNSGNRTSFHYKFLLQRNINNEPITIYNNGIPVLESTYDGNKPVKDISNLSGIKLCEIEIR